MPLIFAPGEAFQFDWSEDWAQVGPRQMKLQVAHFKLRHSRAFMLRAYPLQTHEMLFDAHNHCLRALGGIPRRGIYDNMKTAVDKVGRGKQRETARSMRAFVQWSAILRSRQTFVTRRLAGRKVRSRRTSAMPVSVSGTMHRHFVIWLH